MLSNRPFVKKLFVLLTCVIAISLLSLPARPALAAGSPTAPVITSVACTVTVAFDATSATNYEVAIYDDHVLVFDQTQNAAAVGQTLAFTYTFTKIGTLVPGIGILIYESGSEVYANDPYTTLDQTCSAALAGGCGLPEGNYQVALTANKKLYWAPDSKKQVTPDTYITAGKVVSVIDNKYPGWLTISWACGIYYIPVGNVVPNTQPSAKPFLNAK